MKRFHSILRLLIFIAGSVSAENIHQPFHVQLPTEANPFPHPLADEQKHGFQFRGTKGWAWTPDQYLTEIPYLVKFKMNFLMNCYFSMFDLEHHPDFGDGHANRWWEDLPTQKKSAYEKVVRACQSNGIQFCFSMNPNLDSTRMANDGAPDSIDQLYKHYAWMQSLGVKWFNLSLDDIAQGINAASQAHVVNEIFHRLRARDPEAQMIFCPTFYWGDGTEPKQKAYLEDLARLVDKDIYMFWTGDAVVGPVTRKAAERFRRICGHRLFLWDNYPVNDNQPAMHLGPVIDRAPDLGDVIEGYVCNPHRKETEANRIPLATCADYAYNPRAYDPMRSIGQAIFLLGKTTAQREALRDLVETYPGMLICRQYNTGFDSVRYRFDRILAGPDAKHLSRDFLISLESLSRRLNAEFPNSYQPEKEVLETDLRSVKDQFARKFPEAK